MSGLGAAAGLVLLALILSLVLKKDAPVIAFLLVLAAGVLLLLGAFAQLSGAMQRFAALLQQGGMGDSLYLPVLRAVGVAVVVRILAALCRDGGQSALAAKVEIAGALAALAVSLPLLEQVPDLLTGWTV